MTIPPELASLHRQGSRVVRVAPRQRPADGWAGRHYCSPPTWAYPEKRKRPEQFDTHDVYNSKVDALTHQLSDLMPLCASFRRALHGHTTVWYEPLKEENVGHGGCHEVTGDVYKHGLG